MSGAFSDTLVLALMVPVLVLTAYWDLREFRIPNQLVVAAVLVFAVASAPALGWGEIGWRVLGALILFAIGFAGFAAGKVGAGDVKMLTALALFVEGAHVSLALLLLAVCAIAGLSVVKLIRLTLSPGGGGPIGAWQVWRRAGEFPMGFSISGAALLYLAFRVWQ